MSELNLKENFGTLSETINALSQLGYTHDFNINDECLVCHKTHVTLSPDDFQIDKVYRFEGASDPDNQSILYAISSINSDVKGVLVNGYGISSDESTSKLVEKLKTHSETLVGPNGGHTLNVPLTEMNLHESMEQLKNTISWVEKDRNSIILFKSETMQVVLIGLHENAELTPHKTRGVITVQVLEGKINFIAGTQSSILEKGHVIAVEENCMHSVIALKQSFFLLTIALKPAEK